MIFEAQLPGFVPASEIPSGNLSREEELEELVRKLSADAERRTDMDNSGPAGQAACRLPAGPKPQEWQSLQIVINDLLEAKKDLQATVKKLTIQIEELKQSCRIKKLLSLFRRRGSISILSISSTSKTEWTQSHNPSRKTRARY